MASRYYKNEYPDYSDSSQDTIINKDTNDLHDDFKLRLKTSVTTFLNMTVLDELPRSQCAGFSVYVGTSGVAYMMYKYGKFFGKNEYITRAINMLRQNIDTAIERYSTRRSKPPISFLNGFTGPYALAAVMFHSQGMHEESQRMISNIKAFSTSVLKKDNDIPNELLYGRSGYLFCLLFVNANISPPPIQEKRITKVVLSILHSGMDYSNANNCETPLMYSWHNKEYLGGAHGIGGILYILLQARKYLTEDELQNLIKPALIYLQNIRFPHGNFPSSVGNREDRLVQWCHGAPGMTMLFSLAYEVFQEDQFLETALQCGEVIWQRGLLKKGSGLCHGVSGNAYSFLCLYQLTKDVKHLYRACKFAEWCMDNGMSHAAIPDTPHSLFEGLAGLIYFLIDLCDPHSAKFPAYTL